MQRAIALLLFISIICLNGCGHRLPFVDSNPDDQLDWNEEYITTELWMVDVATGHKQQLYASGSGTFGIGNIEVSPDNRFVLFEQDIRYHWLYDVQEEHLITVNESLLLYAWDKLNASQYYYLPKEKGSFCKKDVLTGRNEVLFHTPDTCLSTLRLTSDQSRCLFYEVIDSNHHERNIHIIRSTGEEIKTIRTSDEMAAFFRWCPDNTHLAIRLRYRVTGNQDIFIYDTERLTETYRMKHNINTEVCWNHDGSKTYLLVPDDREETWSIVEMNPDGSQAVTLNTFTDYYSTNKTDAEYLAGLHAIKFWEYLVNLDTYAISKFRYDFYSMSDDRTRVASWDSNRSKLYIENINGSGKLFLTDFSGKGIRGVRWSPDKSKLVVVAGVIGKI